MKGFHEALGTSEEIAAQADLGQVMIVGDTQTGKTTLLVRLLGIDAPARVQEATNVPRGNRGIGRSATASPTKYRWSLDGTQWSFQRQDGLKTEYLDAGQLRDALDTLRTSNDNALHVFSDEWVRRHLHERRARLHWLILAALLVVVLATGR